MSMIKKRLAQIEKELARKNDEGGIKVYFQGTEEYDQAINADYVYDDPNTILVSFVAPGDLQESS